MMQNSPYLCSCYTSRLTIMCALVVGLRCTVPRTPPFYGFHVHVLYSLLGTNQFPSKICVRFQIFSNPEFYAVDMFSDISPRQLYHFHCINSTRNSCFICKYVGYEGGPKNNRNLNVARELEVVARCPARCRESTPYSCSLTPRG
jgi:hypothetical protein